MGPQRDAERCARSVPVPELLKEQVVAKMEKRGLDTVAKGKEDDQRQPKSPMALDRSPESVFTRDANLGPKRTLEGTGAAWAKRKNRQARSQKEHRTCIAEHGPCFKNWRGRGRERPRSVHPKNKGPRRATRELGYEDR